MINMNLNDEERTKLIEETNKLIHESFFLKADIDALKEQLAKITFLNKSYSNSNKELSKLFEKRIRIKSRRLISVMKKIDLNKEILGLKEEEKKKKKKKNKTL